jgi:hypothetical protein
MPDFAAIEHLTVDSDTLDRAPQVLAVLCELVTLHVSTSASALPPSSTHAQLRWTKQGWELAAARSQTFASITQLLNAWQLATNGPWHFRVDAECESVEDLQLFLQWMREQHLHEVLATKLVARAWIEQPSERTLSMVYVFKTRVLYDRYVEHYAPAIRERGLAQVPVAVTYRRSVAQRVFVAGG